MSDTDLIKLYSGRILELAADIPHLGRLPAPGGSAKPIPSSTRFQAPRVRFSRCVCDSRCTCSMDFRMKSLCPRGAASALMKLVPLSRRSRRPVKS